MAYVERWWTSFKPLGQAFTCTVRIKEDGYVGGTTAIENLAKEPIQYRNRGNDIFTIGAVIGTEVEFSFWISPSDGAIYDDLFTATDRKYLFEIEIDSVLDFVGYMKPENISKPLIEQKYMVSLSATDGLGYLKGVEFKDLNGSLHTDTNTIIEQVKRALTLTGHELDIEVKLGTWEASEMLSTECALKETTVDSTRFIEGSSGVIRADSCSDVLTNILGIFNCSIMQLAGVWHIFNNSEINSFLFTYDWATLTQQSRVAHNPTLAIDAYEFNSVGGVSYRPPINKLEVTFQNKYVPTTLISNGDFSNGTTGWTNGTAPNNMGSFSVVSEELKCLVPDIQTDNRWFTSASFTVAKASDTDKLMVSLRAKGELSNEEEELPFLHVLITGPDGSVEVPLGKMSNEWKLHEPITPPDILGDGSYTIRIVAEADPIILSALTMYFDDISFYVDYGGTAVTVDTVHSIKNDNVIEGVIEEAIVKAGDSQYTNDKGALTIGGVLTDAWNTYGSTEGKELIELLGVKQLELKQAYVGYLSLVISDPSNNIKRNSIISYDSKNYRIVRFNKRFVNVKVDINLIEINSGAVTYTKTKENSTNIDGESQTGTSTSPNITGIAGAIAVNQIAYGTAANTIGGNANFVWDIANSRLGLGLTTPKVKLHLHEITSGGIGIDFTNSTTGLTAGSGLTIGMDASENAFFWHREDQDIYFGTGVTTTERFRIKSNGDSLFSNGNVGIGVASPDRRLHVSSGTSNTIAKFESTDAYAIIELRDNTTTNTEASNEVLRRLGNVTSIHSGGLQAITILADGKVGIGASSPTLGLHIADTHGLLVGSPTTGGSFFVSPTYENTIGAGYGSNLDTVDLWINYQGYLDGITKFRNFKVADGKRNPILSVIGISGNVGVGTTNPVLDSLGKGLVVRGAGYSQLRLESSASSAGIEFQPSTGDLYEIQASAASDWFVYNRTKSAYRLAIDINGYVGIGTVSPVYQLTINSNNSLSSFAQFVNNVTGVSTSDGFIVGLNNSEMAAIHNFENTQMNFGTNNITRMTIAAAGTITAFYNVYAPNFYDSSDRSLKKKTKPIETKYLDSFEDIEAVQYKLKKGDNSLQFGVIAQDIKKDYPDLVSVDSDGMLSVNYRSLAMVTLRKVQDLEKKLKEIQSYG